MFPSSPIRGSTASFPNRTRISAILGGERRLRRSERADQLGHRARIADSSESPQGGAADIFVFVLDVPENLEERGNRAGGPDPAEPFRRHRPPLPGGGIPKVVDVASGDSQVVEGPDQALPGLRRDAFARLVQKRLP
jgi:hypothetical protein